jgi:uncharacterized protein (DUF1499 family)
VLPIESPLAPPGSQARAADVARALGWRISEDDPESGRIEAVATTRVFGFEDDVVIRVRARGSAARVDLRSRSRFGQGDLGANAARIRAFGAAFRAASR